MAKLSGLLQRLPDANPAHVAAMAPMAPKKSEAEIAAELKLSAITPTSFVAALSDSAIKAEVADEAVDLDMSLIDVSPYQPRIRFNQEKLRQLADTISENQLINAITVRKKNGRYEIIAGERRYRAHDLLNRTTIKARIVAMSDADASIAALTENESREDLCDYERGRSYRQNLQDGFAKDQAKLARKIGVPTATISRCLSFFKLPEGAINMLNDNPDLLGGTNAAVLSGFAAAGHAEIVITAIKRIRDNNISEQVAVDWAKGEVRNLGKVVVETPSPRQLILNGKHLGDFAVKGKEVVFSCQKGVLPEELIIKLTDLLARE